jgi:hypothetical protein
MTMRPFAKILSWRAPGNCFLFIALAVTAGLSGCGTLSRYEQSPAPPAPVALPPSPDAALHAAEVHGYEEGLEAGKRIQGRHDRALTQAAENKAASAAAALAQVAIEETQDLQMLQKVCAGPQPGVKLAPAPAPANTTAATKTSPPDVFAPSGPARPLGASPSPF